MWHNVTQRELKKLESLDAYLIRRAFQANSKTSICLMMLELNIIPIRFIIILKRLLYLHHLLTREKLSLACQVLDQQIRKCGKGDWFKVCQKNIRDIGISQLFSNITSVSKSYYKKQLKFACENAAFTYLINQKDKLSKGKEINYNNFQMQNYFKSENNLNLKLMRQIFLLRVRNLPVKCNFPSQYSDVKCVINICEGDDSQSHLYFCDFVSPKNVITTRNINYNDIFMTDVSKQVTVTHIIMQKYQSRLNIMSPASGNPADPSV